MKNRAWPFKTFHSRTEARWEMTYDGVGETYDNIIEFNDALIYANANVYFMR